MLLLEQLNTAQRQAVMHGEGPLLVLAGPGSGKTFTITQRIHYLIQNLSVPPEEILVITFTKEAALSMQRRFQDQSEHNYPVNFGTFHSVFYHILKQSKVFENRQIIGESHKKNLIYPIIKKYYCRLHKDEDEHYESLSEIVTLFLSAISFYKNTGNREETLNKLPQEWKNVFDAIYKEYEIVRKQRNVMDFDDMVYECAILLEENPQLRAYWQGRFSHILMDEFQDICPMQYRVIGLLTKEPYHLFAVGDDDQAIYGFRGSNPACLKQFQKDYQAKQVILNVNYRSNEEIVKASTLVIGENKERFQKELVAASKNNLHTGVTIKVFTEREYQYQYLTERLWTVTEGDTYAILFRTNAYMQEFAAKLNCAGISYTMKEKVTSIYENNIVKDIMAYLRLGAGERSRDLWIRILNKPLRYISREVMAGHEELTIEDMKAYYEKGTAPGTSFLYGDKVRSAIGILEKHLKYLQNASPFLAVQYIRKVIGYEKYILETGRNMKNGRERVEEFLERMNWLSEDAKHYSSLEDWLMAQRQYALTLGNIEKQSNNIHLMTIHASKGLEFEHVWIPDCNEKVFPHGNMPDHQICEEERRIFYVGMTRAKKSLELLCSTGTRERPRLISRFLNPIWKAYSSSFTTSSNSH